MTEELNRFQKERAAEVAHVLRAFAVAQVGATAVKVGVVMAGERVVVESLHTEQDEARKSGSECRDVGEGEAH